MEQSWYFSEKIIEILPNGRPVIIDNEFRFTVKLSNGADPLQLILMNKRNEVIAQVAFSSSADKNISEPVSEGSIDFSSGEDIAVFNTSDRWRWQFFESDVLKFRDSVALIDLETATTVGVLTPRGQFFSDNKEISLLIKPTLSETDPLLFQVTKNQKELPGEFFVPLEKILWVEK